MSLLQRWKSPTPAFFKKIINLSIILGCAATANMMAGTIGSKIIPGFTWTLYPWALSICKYLVVGSIIAGGVAKFAKSDKVEETLTIKKTTEIEEPKKDF